MYIKDRNASAILKLYVFGVGASSNFINVSCDQKFLYAFNDLLDNIVQSKCTLILFKKLLFILIISIPIQKSGEILRFH